MTPELLEEREDGAIVMRYARDDRHDSGGVFTKESADLLVGQIANFHRPGADGTHAYQCAEAHVEEDGSLVGVFTPWTSIAAPIDELPPAPADVSTGIADE